MTLLSWSALNPIPYFTISTTMMTNLGCRLDYIWRQLKVKRRDTSVRGFSWLDYLSWKTHPQSGPHLLVAAHIKGPGKGKFLLFVCLPLLLIDAILLLKHPRAGIRTNFRIPGETEHQQLYGIPRSCGTRLGLPRHPGSRNELLDSCPFPQ